MKWKKKKVKIQEKKGISFQFSSTVGENALSPTVDRCMNEIANFPAVLLMAKVEVSGHESSKYISYNRRKLSYNI